MSILISLCYNKSIMEDSSDYMKINFKYIVLLIALFAANILVVKATPTLVTPQYSTNENIVADTVLEPTSNKATDRTNDIKNALNTCKSNRGGTVFLKAGVYRISSTITVPRNCTLQGDYQNPDSSNTTINYGTIIVADVKTFTYDNVNVEKTGLIKVSSGSGLVGLTFYYENQGYTLSTYTDAPWTIYYGHGELDGNNVSYDPNTGALLNPNYRASIYTIKNITLLNSFRGIGTSVTDDIPIECMEIENVRGTALYKGVVLHNFSEAGSMTILKLMPDYWVNMNKSAIGTDDSIPTKEQVVSFLRTASATGLYITDAEMYQMSSVLIDSYKYCMYIPGSYDISTYGVNRRAMGSGLIFNMTLSNCVEGIHASDNYFVHNRLGYQISHANISGSTYSIFNDTDPNPTNTNVSSVFKLDDVKLTGKTGGKAPTLYYNTSSKKYQQLPSGTSSMPDGLKSNNTLELLYTSRSTKSTATNFEYMDALSLTDDVAIQSKLDSLASKGGGVLYLKPGVYEIYTQIKVPENVQLRGSQGVLSRQAGKPDGSGYIGTVLNIHPSYIATNYGSAVELDGDNAGVSGIVFTYKDNIESMQGSNPTYTVSAPTIGAHNHKGNYVTNVTIMGAAFGIAFDGCNYFTVNNYASTTFNIAIWAKNSNYGLIKNTLGNATVLSLNSLYNFPENYFGNLLNYTHNQLQYIQLENSKYIDGLNNFVYGPQTFATISNSSGYFVNSGNDSYPDVTNASQFYMFNFYNSNKSNFTIINAHRFNGNPGALYNTIESGNIVNVYNSMPLRLNASNNDAKYENDRRSAYGHQAPQTNEVILDYNPKKISGVTNLTYNNGANLVTATGGTGTVYYGTTKLTKSNFQSSGSTTIPKNSNINVGNKVIYYYIPENSTYFEKSGSVTSTIIKKDISSVTVTLSQTTYTANNTERKPTPTVKDGSKTLVKDTDYTVTYQNNKNAGTATVIITGKGNYEGSISKNFSIVRSITKVEVTKQPLKTSYIQNYEDLDLTGGELTITYSDGKTLTLSLKNKNITVTGFDNTTVGTKELTATYSGKTAKFNVSVVEKQIIGIEVSKNPLKLNYIQNYDNLDLTGGVIKVNFNDESSTTVSMTNSGITATGFDKTKPAGTNETITLTYKGHTTTIQVKIVSKQVDGISMKTLPTKTSYIVNYESLDKSGGVVQLHYTNNTTSTLSLSDSKITVTGFDNSVVKENQKLTVKYGNYTTSFNVSIVDKEVESISMTNGDMPRQLTYIKGEDTLDLTGGRIRVKFNDNSETTVKLTDSKVTVSGFDTSSVGEKTLTVNYQSNNANHETFTTSFNINVIEKTVTGIHISSVPTKTEYIEGTDSLSLAGGTVDVLFNDSTTQTISMKNSKISVSGFDGDQIGEQTITVKYTPGNFTDTFTVDVISKQITSIRVSKAPIQTTYFVNQDSELDLTGGELETTYSDGDKETIALSNSSITTSQLDTSSEGDKDITVSYLGLNDKFTVSVVDKNINSIRMKTLPSKVTYIQDFEDLDLTGGVVELIFSDGTKTDMPLLQEIFEITGFDNQEIGTTKITVKLDDDKTTFNVEIIPPQIYKIELIKEPTKKVYIQNHDELDLEGGVIRAHYTNNEYVDVALTNNLVKVTGFDNKNVGTIKLAISYLDIETYFNVDIVSKSISSIKVSKNPIQMEYNVGSLFTDLAGGELTIYYNDGSTSLVSMTSESVKGTLLSEIDNNKGIIRLEYEGFKTDLEVNIVPLSEDEKLQRKCKIIDGKYYDQHGNQVSKSDYDNVCQSNVDTGSFAPIKFIIIGVISSIIIFVYVKKHHIIKKL